MVQGKADKKAINIKAGAFMARTLDGIGKKCPAEGEANVGHMKKPNSIMPENYEEFISLTLRTRNSKKPLGMLENLEIPTAPAMPCKTCKKNKHGETCGKSNEIKSKLACILEASESTRLRMEESLPNHHEDHIAGKGDNLLQLYNFVHKFIPMPQAMKIPQQRQQWINNERNLKRFRRGT